MLFFDESMNNLMDSDVIRRVCRGKVKS